ncbi:NADP-dependent oxidoreductase [Pedobacter nutrimenti]|uniref:NADPH:quinone reductase-like Zn-dependent oxidoreductase n=1 Tax=Pedobacter nutrimenti TaxID=1241337 RepID=A0A318UFH9_9SPHI|nr:NADP-dependent oxidoreductase [Pedobacter nutrimenti]PYF75152.1 NADPH:quinone reductase-like Zn-dependent oxidoreductase [Pedobacter nutrimenti]
MKAIVITATGDKDQLKFVEIPLPEIKDGEVLIQVKAFSINPVDIKTRKGNAIYEKIAADGPVILGWDVSGVVTRSASDLFKTGDEVFGMVNFPGHGKAYAEYVAAPADQLALKPANISHKEAAAATLAALTAWQALVSNAGVKTGDRVLIQAAAGGVGHYAVQIAKHLGAFVIGTSSAQNKEFVLSLGTDQHLDYKAQAFETVLKDLDLVLDAMGGDYIDRSLEVIRPGGTLITLPSGLSEGIAKKSEAKKINGYHIMVKSNGKDMQSLADLLEKGIIKSHVSQSFSFEEIKQAHEQIESGRTIGKIVVEF